MNTLQSIEHSPLTKPPSSSLGSLVNPCSTLHASRFARHLARHLGSHRQPFMQP